MKYLLIAVLLFASSCTDATWESVAAYGEKHKITLYSGGVAVRTWTSTGKVASMSQSDGWQFKDTKTQRLVRVGGNVVVEVIK